MDNSIIKQIYIFFGIIVLICVFIAVYAFIKVDNMHRATFPYYQHFTCDNSSCHIITLNGLHQKYSDTNFDKSDIIRFEFSEKEHLVETLRLGSRYTVTYHVKIHTKQGNGYLLMGSSYYKQPHFNAINKLNELLKKDKNIDVFINPRQSKNNIYKFNK